MNLVKLKLERTLHLESGIYKGDLERFLRLINQFFKRVKLMPKPRKLAKLKLKKRLFIVCEGKETEPNYLKALIDELDFNGVPVEIKVVDTKINTPKELVAVAKSLKEVKQDEAWAVFDKDGYTKHPEAFEHARQSDVNIAFSLISFEYWILLHFTYTTKIFAKSEDVIKYIEDNNFITSYSKEGSNYEKTKSKLDVAERNAKKLRSNLSQSEDMTRPYELTSFTNVDELVEALREIKKEYS